MIPPKRKCNTEFDHLLHKTIGYDALRIMTVDFFLAPYSITSLREYFARGVEEYYLGEKQYLRELCPYIYEKIYLLERIEEGERDYEF